MTPNRSNTNKIIFGAIIISLGLFIFYGLSEFFSAFLGAVVFYVLFKNMMNAMVKKWRLSRSLSAIMIICLSFVIVVIPLSMIGGTVYIELISWLRSPDLINSSFHELSAVLDKYSVSISSAELTGDLQRLMAKLAPGIFSSTLSLMGNMLMMYFFLYFLLVNSGRLEAFIVLIAPFERSKMMPLGKELVMQTYGNAVGVPLVAIVQGILAYIEFSICGVPHSGVWATLTGLASIIPIVGTGVVWVPAALASLVSGNIWQGIFILVYGLVIISTSDNLVRIMVSKKVGNVHPLVTVLGVVLGLKFLGLPGLVFGPLLISYFFLLMKLYFYKYNHGQVYRGNPEN